jgi:hypothetical protein
MTSIFIGTLYNGEAEFDNHIESLFNQVDIDFHHHVIKNLSEYKAHKQLWIDWQNNQSKYDLFVKIDADTVLNRNSALFEIARLFEDPEVTAAQIRLMDFYSKSLIAGLNAFSPVVKFRNNSKRLFPDRVDYNHNKILLPGSTQQLEPIGYHCLFPNTRQAFYYGYHRMLKKQFGILKLVASEWIINQDEARLWAILGAQSANKFSLLKKFYSSEFVEIIYRNRSFKNDYSFEEFVSRLLEYEEK